MSSYRKSSMKSETLSGGSLLRSRRVSHKVKYLDESQRAFTGNIRDLFESIDFAIIVCEGVLWVGQKYQIGASEFVAKLKEMNIKIVFITNDDSVSRKDVVDRLQDCGINDIDQKMILPCGYATAFYVKEKLKLSEVFCLGSEVLAHELRSQDIQVLIWNENGKAPLLEFLKLNEVKAIVLGLYMKFNFRIAFDIATYLRWDKNVKFVVTNMQPTYVTINGVLLPGVKSMVSMIKEIGGRSPDHVIGRPEEPFLRLLMASHVIVPEKTLLIGERLESDMLFAWRSGFTSLLVLSGCADKTEAQLKEFSDSNSERATAPNYIMDNVLELSRLLRDTETKETEETLEDSEETASALE